jgi:hypothetical protein
MNEKTEKHLISQLIKIEKLAQQIGAQRGYCREMRALKILAELIKEQNPNANSGSTTRSLR